MTGLGFAELDTSFPDLPFMTVAPGLEAASSCILLAGLDRSGVRMFGYLKTTVRAVESVLLGGQDLGSPFY